MQYVQIGLLAASTNFAGGVLGVGGSGIPVASMALLAVVGILTGLLGGMLGIGGSVIMIPAMVWIIGATNAAGTDMMHQYQAVAMIVNFLLSVPAVMAHVKKKAVWPKVVAPLMAAGVVGVVAGTLLSMQFDGKYLRWGLGVFLIYAGSEAVWKTIRPPKSDGLTYEQVAAGPLLPKLGIGSTVGVFAGLTGLGGGALAVPSQQWLLKVPIRNAIANSAALIVSMAWLGAIVKNAGLVATGPGPRGSVSQSLLLAACLAPTAMIASYIGGHMTHTLPAKAVRLAFGVLVLASTYRMFSGMGSAIGSLFG